MQIDGISLRHRGDEPAWQFLFELTRSQLRMTDVDYEGFIQGSCGPNSFDITPSYRPLQNTDVIVVNDRDEDGCIRFVDPKGVTYLADRELYKAAEAIRPDRYLFIDLNYPEVVYRGTRADFEWVQDEGGFPKVFFGPHNMSGTRAMLGDEWVEIIELNLD